MNGEVTVENLTIRDIFWNNSNSTGYAFCYQNNADIQLRSAYVRNVTVLNRGSVTTSSDPYGFAAAGSSNGLRIKTAR